MAPKSVWQDFVHAGVVCKKAKHGSGEEVYDTWTCPHCEELVEALKSVENRKGRTCTNHFWKAKVPCAKRPETDLRGQPKPLEAIAGQRCAPDRGRDDPKSSKAATHAYQSDLDDDLVLYTVYGLRYLLLNLYVYVGHTHNKLQRFGSHINLTSGCRRVAIALAQPNVQPVTQHFVLEELWSGACSPSEARAVEQFYMDKHNTRVVHRPTNGVTKDIDLINGASPRQLNVARACKDASLVKWAGERVARDTQLVVKRSPEEEQAMRSMLLMLLQPSNAPAAPDEEAEEEEEEVVKEEDAPAPEPEAEPVEHEAKMRWLNIKLLRAQIEREKATTEAEKCRAERERATTRAQTKTAEAEECRAEREKSTTELNRELIISARCKRKRIEENLLPQPQNDTGDDEN